MSTGHIPAKLPCQEGFCPRVLDRTYSDKICSHQAGTVSDNNSGRKNSIMPQNEFAGVRSIMQILFYSTKLKKSIHYSTQKRHSSRYLTYCRCTIESGIKRSGMHLEMCFIFHLLTTG